jgi:hypothetical protein
VSIRIMSEVWKTKLPTSEKMVLLVIADHASDDGTEAWPSQRLIAEKASLTIRTVQRCINNLQAEGWLHMEKRAGGSVNCRDDRRPNKYTLHLGKLRGEIVSPRKQRGEIEAGDEAKSAPATRRNSRPMNHPKETPYETPQSEDSLRETVQAGVLGSLPEETKATQETPVFSSKTQETPPEQVFSEKTPKTGVSFEDFYEAYPRKTAKGAARKAWEKLSLEDQEKAVAGALRYAHDPNRDESFTAYPATWLNAERWEDEPLPPRKFTPEEMKARELLESRAKAEAEKLKAQKIDEENRRAQQQAVPMPDYLKDLLRRV